MILPRKIGKVIASAWRFGLDKFEYRKARVFEMLRLTIELLKPH